MNGEITTSQDGNKEYQKQNQAPQGNGQPSPQAAGNPLYKESPKSQKLNNNNCSDGPQAIYSSGKMSRNRSSQQRGVRGKLYHQEGGGTEENREDSSGRETSLYKVQNASKLIDRDTQMLNNRIELLRIEENRIKRKMDGARKRADEIMKIKQNNEEKFERRLRIEEDREINIVDNRQKVQKYREERKKDALERGKSMLSKNQDVCRGIKSQSRSNYEMYNQMKTDFVEVNKTRNQIVRNDEYRIANSMQQFRDDKRNNSTIDYTKRVRNEQMALNLKEVRIQQLESQEADLLMRLKNTQRLERKVVGSLEQAINDSITSQRSRLNEKQNRIQTLRKKHYGAIYFNNQK